jgi:hypothetical protein
MKSIDGYLGGNLINHLIIDIYDRKNNSFKAVDSSLMFAPREAYSKEKIKNIYECM